MAASRSACTTWTDNATCGAGSGHVTRRVPGHRFGRHGGTGCGAGDLCLVSTVGTDLTPDACASTDTIDATQGDQLNFCYTVTNNTGVELDYHTLQNNVDGTLFSLMNAARWPRARRYQYNHIETVSRDEHVQLDVDGSGRSAGLPADVETGGGGCADRIFADGFDGSTPPCGGGGGFIDISGTGTALGNGDDESIAVTMPFSFNFYGTTANDICVDNNGFILFNTTNCPTSGFYTNTSLPADFAARPRRSCRCGTTSTASRATSTRIPAAPRRTVSSSSSGISARTSRATPIRATFEVIFDEADGALHFWYSDVDYTAVGNVSGDPDVCDGGLCATIGLQNNPGLFNQYSAFEASVTDGSGIAWTPTNPQVFTGSDSVTVNVGAPDINVTPPSITGTVAAGGTASTIMDIQNLGNRDLIWTADEAPPPNFHFPIGPRYAPSTLRPGETNVGRQRPTQDGCTRTAVRGCFDEGHAFDVSRRSARSRRRSDAASSRRRPASSSASTPMRRAR